MAAPPARTALRLAKVPIPYGVVEVSPKRTFTSARGMVSSSATTWAKVVSWPWPWLWVETWAVTLPEGSIRSCVDSYPKMMGTPRLMNSFVVWAVCSV